MFAGPTLGWGILRHGAKYLPSPADQSKPLILTVEQVDIVLRWYAVDEAGEFIYRRGAIEMAKGWGKSPLAAFLAIEELVGPVLFDHWGSDGQPVGRPWDNPVVEIAAVSEDQTDNTHGAIFESLAANDGRAAKALGIDNGRTRLYLNGRPGHLRPVTAAAASREGARVTFAILDETHLWTRRNGGVKLAATIRRNVAKMSGRTVETTNAPLLGEKSVAEQSDAMAGVFHYARRPEVEPDPAWDDDRLVAALDEAYGDASWIDRRRLVAEIRDPATSWDDAVRFYFNIRSAGSGRAVDPRTWDALGRPRDVPSGAHIGLGFTGSHDVILRGCTADGYSFLVRSWLRPTGTQFDAWIDAHPGQSDWRPDRTDVATTLAETFARYRVGRMYADPPKWATEIEGWQTQYGIDVNKDPIVIALDTNQPRRFAPAVDRWLTAVRAAQHYHDNDPVTNDHVRAAHLRKVRLDDDDDGRTRYVLIRGEERQHIGAAWADVLAYEAAMTMTEPSRKRGGWAFVA